MKTWLKFGLIMAILILSTTSSLLYSAVCGASATSCSITCYATGSRVSCSSGSNWVTCKAFGSNGALVGIAHCECVGEDVFCVE